jgi:CheY-like chemotaxis protein
LEKSKRVYSFRQLLLVEDILNGSDGRSSSFRNYLARKIRASDSSDIKIPHPDNTSTKNILQKKIMIVDDESQIAKLYSLILSNAGFTVSHLEFNGADALARVQSQDSNIDLVIIDQRMPNMDGLTATKLMKELKPDLKVIMVTAYEIPNAEKRLFNAVLTKPASSRSLIDTVARVLKDV